MDHISHCYRSSMRLYRDRPDHLTPGRWHWCPPGAKVIPYFHLFGSHLWDYGDFPCDPPVGEVPIQEGKSSGFSDPRILGQNWCGDEEVWTKGALWSQRGTPPVDVEGVPLCCEVSGPPIGGADCNGEADWPVPIVIPTDCSGVPIPEEMWVTIDDFGQCSEWRGARPVVYDISFGWWRSSVISISGTDYRIQVACADSGGGLFLWSLSINPVGINDFAANSLQTDDPPSAYWPLYFSLGMPCPGIGVDVWFGLAPVPPPIHDTVLGQQLDLVAEVVPVYAAVLGQQLDLVVEAVPDFAAVLGQQLDLVAEALPDFAAVLGQRFDLVAEAVPVYAAVLGQRLDLVAEAVPVYAAVLGQQLDLVAEALP